MLKSQSTDKTTPVRLVVNSENALAVAKKLKTDIDWRPASLCAEAAQIIRDLVAENQQLRSDLNQLKDWNDVLSAGYDAQKAELESVKKTLNRL